MKKFICIFLLLFWVGIQHNTVTAQNWRKIIPLISTCEDVKKTFNIEKCEYPITKHETPDYKVEVELAEKNYSSECDLNSEYKNIAKGTVLSVYVRGGSLLKEFEPDLSGYEVEQVYDLPDNFIYKNKSKGIEFETTGGDKEVEMVFINVTYRPSAENAAKFGCSLQWKELKPFVSHCDDVKRIFKIAKCTFPTTAIKTSRYNLTVNFPANICGKKCSSKTDCWKVSRDTIVSMTVESPFGSEDFTLKDFDSVWDTYFDSKWDTSFKEPVPYYPDLSRYTNEKKGIELEAYRFSNLIHKLRFFPSAEDKKKYKCGK